MDIWGLTHVGVVREQNQDAFEWKKLSNDQGIIIVCDGMGGARAGNIASELAVEAFMSTFFQVDPSGEETTQQRMERAATYANHEVFLRSTTDEACIGMGTTMVAAFLDKGQVALLNEGDSRCYRIAEEGITLLTRDHSLVEELVERGELTRDQARTHPHKNLITRALGAESKLHADFFSSELKEGEFLLLCSDGLSNVMTEQEILYEVLHGGPAEECCSRLLGITLQRGAPDNVTVVLARC